MILKSKAEIESQLLRDFMQMREGDFAGVAIFSATRVVLHAVMTKTYGALRQLRPFFTGDKAFVFETIVVSTYADFLEDGLVAVCQDMRKAFPDLNLPAFDLDGDNVAQAEELRLALEERDDNRALNEVCEQEALIDRLGYKMDEITVRSLIQTVNVLECKGSPKGVAPTLG